MMIELFFSSAYFCLFPGMGDLVCSHLGVYMQPRDIFMIESAKRNYQLGEKATKEEGV